MKYLDPDTELLAKNANPGTPGETFGSREELKWIEKTIAVKPGSNTVIWDALYCTVREGIAFPITMEQALGVMRVISTAKQGIQILYIASVLVFLSGRVVDLPRCQTEILNISFIR